MMKRRLLDIIFIVGFDLSELLNGASELEEVFADFVIGSHDEKFGAKEIVSTGAVHHRRRQEKSRIKRLRKNTFVSLQIIHSARHDHQLGRIAHSGIKDERESVDKLKRAIKLDSG